MVQVKTILGTFDTSTRSFVDKPKPRPTNPLQSFKLVTAPPKIIPVSRFGGQIVQAVKRLNETPRQAETGKSRTVVQAPSTRILQRQKIPPQRNQVVRTSNRESRQVSRSQRTVVRQADIEEFLRSRGR